MPLSPRAKLILIIVLAIVLVVIVRRTNIIATIKRWFTPRYIDYNCTPASATGKVSPDRTAYLDSIAQKIYDDIYNTPYTGHDCTLYQTANALCDEELVYVAEQYRKALSRGTSIVQDLQTQWTLLCDFDIFIAHLQKVGEI